jgi:hypothetical protein
MDHVWFDVNQALHNDQNVPQQYIGQWPAANKAIPKRKNGKHKQLKAFHIKLNHIMANLSRKQINKEMQETVWKKYMNLRMHTCLLGAYACTR